MWKTLYETVCEHGILSLDDDPQLNGHFAEFDAVRSSLAGNDRMRFEETCKLIVDGKMTTKSLFSTAIWSVSIKMKNSTISLSF